MKNDDEPMPGLVSNLRDWAPGCPIAFASEEADAMKAHYEPLALDALIAAGKIKPEDRARVTFITRIIVDSPHRRANVDDMGSA